MSYDVVIAGAGIAGCTAATIYGRAGLRVALVERSRSATAHKALCGHFVLGGARDTLVRLGLWDEMVAAGAVAAEGLAVWNGEAWIPPQPQVPAGISLRRSVLDPLLREVAGRTEGVDLLMGQSVVGVERRGSAVTGLEVEGEDGRRVLGARLVVAADGHRSPVATLAGVEADVAPNNRMLFWAYWRGALLPGGVPGRVWRLADGGVAVAIPTDDDLLQVGVFPTKAAGAAFLADRVTAYEAAARSLPDGPDLSGADRVSKVVGTTDYPCVRRPPAPRPGLALVGDAATAGDPVPAVGCGWAFRSAEWLAEATIPALRGDESLAVGLRRYGRSYRLLTRYDDLARADALAGPPNAVQRAVARAAAVDPDIARRLAAFAMRSAPPSVLLNPKVVARALRAQRRAGRRPVEGGPVEGRPVGGQPGQGQPASAGLPSAS